MKKPLLFLALIAFMAFWLCGCATTTSGGGSASVPADPNVLRVGVSPSLPPLVFTSNREYRGLEADLARALAADMGKTVRFVEVRWDGLIPALLDGKVDIIMSGMTITQERLMRVNFTRPYVRAGQTVLVRRQDVDRMRLALFSPGTKVGAQKATTGDFYVQQQCPNADRKVFATSSQGARALANRQIEAFVCDAPVNWWLASWKRVTSMPSSEPRRDVSACSCKAPKGTSIPGMPISGTRIPASQMGMNRLSDWGKPWPAPPMACCSRSRRRRMRR